MQDMHAEGKHTSSSADPNMPPILLHLGTRRTTSCTSTCSTLQPRTAPPHHAPTPTTCQLTPPAVHPLTDKDIIGLAQTGSGKTGAFALPILQQLMDKPQELFALVLSPTRELAIQIAEQVEALGAGIGVKCAVLVGGIDLMSQVGR
jgi:hypothetical protein